MRIDNQVIEKVAQNARLKLTKKEIEEFTPQLSEILKTFSKLDQVDTENISPSFQPIELKNILREDEEKKPLTQEEILSNTKHKKDGFFKCPKVI